VALGECGRSYGDVLHPRTQLPALPRFCAPIVPSGPGWVEIRDNLAERIAEAESEGWLGEAEGLQVSLGGARHKLAQMDLIAERRASSVNRGMPTFSRTAARTTTTTDPLGELSTDNEPDELKDAAERPGRGTRRLSLDALRA
jgi:hypothetical protein